VDRTGDVLTATLTAELVARPPGGHPVRIAEDIQLGLPAGRTDGFPLTALDAVGARLLAPRLFAPRARLRGRTDP
jgi:hypothetical protein